MEDLDAIIRELGLENRIFILNELKGSSKTVSESRKALKEEGVKKSFSTVGRYLESLRGIGLVCEDAGRFSLTIKGRLILSYIDEMQRKIDGFKDVEKALSKYPINYLPEEFVRGISVLGNTEIVLEPFDIMWDSVKAVESAKKEVLVVNKDIVNREFAQIAFEKCLGGVKVLSIVDSASVPKRIEMHNDIVKDMEIEGEDLLSLKENFTVRSYSGIPLNLIVTDGIAAGISLPDLKSENSLNPAFKSEDQEFIGWVEGIFKWYWERGEPLSW